MTTMDDRDGPAAGSWRKEHPGGGVLLFRAPHLPGLRVGADNAAADQGRRAAQHRAGHTGCMYVANTTYYSTPWVVPWMHTQLGSSGSAATGTAAGLASMMRKGKMHKEPINVIAFCGDGGGVDMGLSAISAALQHDEYNLLILCYDNESYANTESRCRQLSLGANSTFSPPGKVHRIMNSRWKKNTAPMLAAGHPDVRLHRHLLRLLRAGPEQQIRRALTIAGRRSSTH